MINIVLDLDQTLISSELKNEVDMFPDREKISKFTKSNMDDYYIVFERPHLQVFLDFLFSNFDVSVWTAASKGYALFVIQNHILKNHPERKLDNIFFDYHCKLSRKMRRNSKSLTMLWKHLELQGYDKSNTYILDDYDSVYKHQPDNTIIAKDFEFFEKNSENDVFLLHLIDELKSLKNSDQDHRKGQAGIMNEHLKNV